MHPKKKAQKHTDRKATVRREKIFSRNTKRFQGGGPTVSRHYLNNVLTLSFIRDRDTLTDRETERETDLSKLQIGDAFLSLFLHKSASE